MKARPDSRLTAQLVAILALCGSGCSTQELDTPPTEQVLRGTVLCASARPLTAPGALLATSLEDISKPDDPPLTIARNAATVATGLPTEFHLAYPARIRPDAGSYNLSAVLTMNGRLLHASRVIVDPFRQTSDQSLTIRLDCDSPPDQPLSLTNQFWQATSLVGSKDGATTLERQPFIELAARSGRIRGHSGCRAFGGTFKVDHGKRSLLFDDLQGSQPGCVSTGLAEGKQRDPFLERLAAVDHYAIEGYHLRLLGRDGTVLMHLLAVQRP